ncbi:FAD-binding protein [Saccharopolyspora sp. ASAGF58]|uniref:FAD-binding protein n=1 Tax=Saccharopolyspora sp. ASAGF58 TaxID=2719023 RepID=UPI001B314699|nr:FAD-binding protein [Saccharopolyspora sp. ASAGF58]
MKRCDEVFGRGCGTGLAGQSVNSAVMFDFSRYMHDIVELDPQLRIARVRPGVICDQLRKWKTNCANTAEGGDPAARARGGTECWTGILDDLAVCK